ncbi:MAG: hypothetical protein IJM59_06105, partial [Proteobacteria bacterium]|nr:hypothetical protein [Pseudomonadota bacterium]
MKHFSSSKIAAILAIASMAALYGCENESSSSSETLTCPSDAPLCGGVCCPYECNNNECAFPGGSTTPDPKTEDDCTKNGQTFCSGKCVSTQSDPMHCGDCT